MLKAKHELFAPVSYFYEGKKYVATFDGGPRWLIFANGKEYSFNLGTPDWIKKTFYPKGSASIAYIIDYNYEVVDDEASADKIVSTQNGRIIYYKEGEEEFVAHAETPLDSISGIIMCNKQLYKVTRTKKSWRIYIIKIYEKDNLIAIIRSGLLRIKTKFKKDLPLNERIFITLLSTIWKY